MKLLVMILSISSAMSYELTEKALVDLSKTSSPHLDQIMSRQFMSKSSLDQSQDILGTNLYFGVDHANTKERGMISFNPVFNNINQYTAGIKRNFKHGFSLDLNASVDQRSGSSLAGTEFKDIHTTIYSLGIGIDLWKDLFGRTTRKNLENAKLNFELTKHKSEIEKAVFTNTVRSLYWTMVANKEKLKITEKLLNTARKQASLAAQRKKNSIADTAEVARYESQVSQRQASLVSLRYETEVLNKRLRDFFPALSTESLSLYKYDINSAFKGLMECTTQINTLKKAPVEFSRYDEINSLLETIQKNQQAIDSSYDAIDIKLNASVYKTGIASDDTLGDGSLYEGDYQGSLNDFNDNDRSGFKAGLMVNIPIGKKYQGSSESLKKYNELRLQSEQKMMMSKVENTHLQISKSINYLLEVISAQSENTTKLKIQVKEMKKKYAQARVPVHLLIQDQDALMSSELRVIDTKLMIANIMLDYFNVFNSIPCGFNKVQ